MWEHGNHHEFVQASAGADFQEKTLVAQTFLLETITTPTRSKTQMETPAGSSVPRKTAEAAARRKFATLESRSNGRYLDQLSHVLLEASDAIDNFEAGSVSERAALIAVENADRVVRTFILRRVGPFRSPGPDAFKEAVRDFSGVITELLGRIDRAVAAKPPLKKRWQALRDADADERPSGSWPQIIVDGAPRYARVIEIDPAFGKDSAGTLQPKYLPPLASVSIFKELRRNIEYVLTHAKARCPLGTTYTKVSLQSCNLMIVVRDKSLVNTHVIVDDTSDSDATEDEFESIEKTGEDIIAILLGNIDESKKTLYISVLCADPRSQVSNVGRLALREALNFAKRYSLNVTLHALSDVIPYYAKEGFQLRDSCDPSADILPLEDGVGGDLRKHAKSNAAKRLLIHAVASGLDASCSRDVFSDFGPGLVDDDNIDAAYVRYMNKSCGSYGITMTRCGAHVPERHELPSASKRARADGSP